MRNFRFSGIGFLAVLLVSGVPGKASGGDKAAPILPVFFIEAGPTVDGSPLDPVWSRASAESVFHPLGKPDMVSRLTTVRALYDRSSLYLLFECRGKPSRDLAATTIVRDGEVWEGDDDLEFFFFPGEQDSLYVQLLTNPLGAKVDLELSQAREGHSAGGSWKDYVWTVQTDWREEGWIVEMSVPLRQFAARVDAGEKWTANFARYLRISPDERALLSWGPAISSFHEPGNFGELQFEKSVEFMPVAAKADRLGDEIRALDNLRKRGGTNYYSSFRKYLDEITASPGDGRPYEFICERAKEFAREFPDSLDAVTLSLRVIVPAGASGKVPHEQVERFSREIREQLEFEGVERGLFELARGQYLRRRGRIEDGREVLRTVAEKESLLTGTASFLFVVQAERDDPELPDALRTFFRSVLEERGPLYLDPETRLLSARPARHGVADLVYSVLDRAVDVLPGDVMEVTRSTLAEPDIPEDLRVVMMKIRYKLVAPPDSPFFSPAAAESLALAMGPLDVEYADRLLSAMLHRKDEELTLKFAIMGGDSFPEEVRDAVSLRKNLGHPHPIDRILSCYYERADSLERAIAFMEEYAEASRRGWWNYEREQLRLEDALMRLEELELRRTHRGDPDFLKMPDDSFRIVYERKAARSSPMYLEIANDRRAVLYPPGAGPFARRAEISLTVPSEVDSPAIAFSMPRAEVDSVYEILSRHRFLTFGPLYAYPCEGCGDVAISLFTPRNMRTVRFAGSEQGSEYSRCEMAVSSILKRYMDHVQTYQSDWKRLSRALQVFAGSAAPERPPEERLDLLIDFFSEERPHLVRDDSWFVTRMLELASRTGREAEVHAILGTRYFDLAFRWREDAPASLPDAGDPKIALARAHLAEAIAGASDDEAKQWFGFLMNFSYGFKGSIRDLEEDAGSFAARRSRANAQLLLVWFACTLEDLSLARSLHGSLLESDVADSLKALVTLRMLLETRERGEYAQALEYLTVLENNFIGFIPSGRRVVPREALHHYSRIDLLVEKAYLLFGMGEFDEAAKIVDELGDEVMPSDVRTYYGEFLLLRNAEEPPGEFVEEKTPEYRSIIGLLNRYRRYGESAAWVVWVMDRTENENLAWRLSNEMIEILTYREAWDALQKRIAGLLLQEYGRGTPFEWFPRERDRDVAPGTWRQPVQWYPVRPILSAVMKYGTRDDVTDVWRRLILPSPLAALDLIGTDMLIRYFHDIGAVEEEHGVIRKVVREISGLKNARPSRDDNRRATTYELLSAKYLLDIASTDTALVDSLVEALPDLSREAYPRVFMAIAQWKAEHLGWEALAAFVSPRRDSLLEAEKNLPRSIYRPPEYRGEPFDSPLLALACIVREMRGEGHSEPTLVELLGPGVDSVVRRLDEDPAGLDMSCRQARLITWREEPSFGSLLESLKPPPSFVQPQFQLQ